MVNESCEPATSKAAVGTCGVCKCRACGAKNPWRSDFTYAVASDQSVHHRTAIFPGFLGQCRKCGAREAQDVVQITESVEEATNLCDN